MHAAGSRHGIVTLSDEHYMKRRRLFPPSFFAETCSGEDLEGSAEIEDFHLGKDQNADCVLHCNTSCSPETFKNL